MMRDQDRRREGGGAVFDRNASVEQVAETFVARHHREEAKRRSQGPGISGHNFDRSDVSQQALMAGVEDPQIWLVKCQIGEEEVRASILLKEGLQF